MSFNFPRSYSSILAHLRGDKICYMRFVGNCKLFLKNPLCFDEVRVDYNVRIHWRHSVLCVTKRIDVLYLGFEHILSEAVTSPVHVQFANLLARSDKVWHRFNGNRAAHHSFHHHLELGHIFVLGTNNLPPQQTIMKRQSFEVGSLRCLRRNWSNMSTYGPRSTRVPKGCSTCLMVEWLRCRTCDSRSSVRIPVVT